MKCVACDVRLKVGESYWCAACAEEHARGYQANRRRELARLIAVLRGAMLILALLLPSLATAQSQVDLRPITALIAANVADLVSTEIALAQSPHVREANPIMGASSAQRIAVKAAGTALQVWCVRKIGARHPKVAAVVGYSAGAALSAVAIHNLRLAR